MATLRYQAWLNLIGEKLRVYFNVKDVRQLHAFFMDGTELGVLSAARPWCFTPHALRVRQEIYALIRKRKLTFKEGSDPVAAWFAYKRRQAKEHKGAANDLARMLSDRARSSNPSESSTTAPASALIPLGTASTPTGPVPRLTEIFTF